MASLHARQILGRGFFHEEWTEGKINEHDKSTLNSFIQWVDSGDLNNNFLDILDSETSVQELERKLITAPDLISRKGIHGFTLLHLACFLDRVDLVASILSHGGTINSLSNLGETPLNIATAYGCWGSARLLVQNGCQVDVKDHHGETPLLSTIRKLNQKSGQAIEILALLLRRGASAGVQNRIGRNIWHKLSLWSPGDQHENIYELLFQTGGAKTINAGDHIGATPLMLALISGNLPLLCFLHNKQARFDAIDINDESILHWVSEIGDVEVCQLLDSFELSCLDIRSTNKSRETAIDCFRYQVQRNKGAWNSCLGPSRGLILSKITLNDPSQDLISKEKAVAFEKLLRGIRDRSLESEIKELQLLMRKIEQHELSSARDDLRRLRISKSRAKIAWEAETFRAIELDIRAERSSLAVESLKEFISVSQERMKISPFEEEGLSVDTFETWGD
ncbi:ankyrin repeat-containing domain protein [Xylariaceae sp. FL1651]|nr:ankyrin repeat-containing domain protein [Xylariaceae sp. FL1651]